MGMRLLTPWREVEVVPVGALGPGLRVKDLPHDPLRAVAVVPSEDFAADGTPISDAGRRFVAAVAERESAATRRDADGAPTGDGDGHGSM